MDEKSLSVGDKIRELRLRKGLSIEELAKRTGISGASLEQIEARDLSPSLGTIVSLAATLQVPVGELFGDCGESPFCIVRSDNRTSVSRFSPSYSYEGLGLQKKNRQMEPFLVTLHPDKVHKAEANQHIGEEFIFVLEGKVEVEILDHRDILCKGDSIYYDSNVPHTIKCYDEHPATLLAVIYAKEEMIIL